MQPSFISHNPHTTNRRITGGPKKPGDRPHVQIEIVEGRARNKMRTVQAPTYFIGSGSDCDMVLGDSQFAEVHAFLVVHAESVSIRHLGHSPELLVDGQPVDRVELVDGAQIRMGPYELIVHIQKASEAGSDRTNSSPHRIFDRGNTFARIDGPSVGVVPPSVAPPMWQHLGRSRGVAIHSPQERATA